jgi:hypothetical protein
MSLVAALLGFGSSAHADDPIWTTSFTDRGVDYTLTFESLSGNTGTYTLTMDTTGYDQKPDAYLDSVNIKAWDGKDVSFELVSAPDDTKWSLTEGPISSGPTSNSGCRGNTAGFACVEAKSKGVLDVDAGPYTFEFKVTASSADSFYMDPHGVHVGAGYADSTGRGAGYGITSVTVVPEPETYAMLAVGLALMAFVVRRRKTQYAFA